jgi:hypothetical protein
MIKSRRGDVNWWNTADWGLEAGDGKYDRNSSVN